MESHRFCIAPMLNYTDRHYRYLARLLTKHSHLYTEMITTGALIHGNRDQWLRLHTNENPVALQLGGNHPDEMARCAEWAEAYHFDEVNINVGCPSDRVQAKKFGACLMLEPETVAQCIQAMQKASNVQVTVKTRIGVDEQDHYAFLEDFVRQIVHAGCRTVIVHARKAVLSGLTPRQNRTVPPLHYEYVYKLKQDHPELKIIVNGGIKTRQEISAHLQNVDGVMIGREAYDNPFMLADIDECIFGEETAALTRVAVLARYKDYIRAELDKGLPLKVLAQPIFGLFKGLPGARLWRRYLSENIYIEGAGMEVIHEAEACIT